MPNSCPFTQLRSKRERGYDDEVLLINLYGFLRFGSGKIKILVKNDDHDSLIAGHVCVTGWDHSRSKEPGYTSASRKKAHNLRSGNRKSISWDQFTYLDWHFRSVTRMKPFDTAPTALNKLWALKQANPWVPWWVFYPLNWRYKKVLIEPSSSPENGDADLRFSARDLLIITPKRSSPEKENTCIIPLKLDQPITNKCKIKSHISFSLALLDRLSCSYVFTLYPEDSTRLRVSYC